MLQGSQQSGTLGNGPYGGNVQVDRQGRPIGIAPGQDTATSLNSTNEARARASGDVVVAAAELQAEQTRLTHLKRALAQMRPAWPATFDPIDPTALIAPPPPPPDPKAMAAIVEVAAQEKARVNSPFTASGTATGAPDVQAPAAPPAAPAGGAPATSPAPDATPHAPFGPRETDKRPGR